MKALEKIGMGKKTKQDKEPLLTPSADSSSRTSPTPQLQQHAQGVAGGVQRSAFSFTNHGPQASPPSFTFGSAPSFTGQCGLYRYPSWPSSPPPSALGDRPPQNVPPQSVAPNGLPMAQSGRAPSLSHPAHQLASPPPSIVRYSPQPAYAMAHVAAMNLQPPSKAGSKRERSPIFVTALNVVSVAVLIVHLPLAIWFSKYVGPSACLFAIGPLGAFFGLWASMLTPCECYPTLEHATGRVRFFATTSAVFDLFAGIAVPIVMYSIVCPEVGLISCDHDMPIGRGYAFSVSLVMAVHLFLALIVRSNAQYLARRSYDMDAYQQRQYPNGHLYAPTTHFL